MSKYEDPTQLDYRYGGDTVDDFAQKYMKTVAYIFSALNELRSPTGGTLTQNPEAYQLKVDDNKLYIRNQANTDWILLGDVKENFGFRASASDAFMHESDVADSGKAGKLIRADASGKLNADILGNAAKIADKAIQMGLDLADEDRLVYDKDTDTITNRPLQFKVDGDKIYARKDATTGWVLLGDLKQNLGFRSSTDDAFLTESDVTDKGTAGKLIRADVNGKLNADILGNARKMAGKTFAPEDLQDGQIPVYRASDGTWHAENKGTVGTGKNLMIMDGDKMLGEYNGDEMKAIDIQKSSLTKALAESTGYGIVSGCEPSINGLTVTVSAGVIHTADGRRVEVPEQSITLDAADATKPRTDVVYLDKYGKIAKLTGELGTPAVAGSNTYTISTNFAVGDTVTFGGVTFTCTSSTQDATNFALGADTTTSATNLTTALNANSTISDIYTAVTSGAGITLTEKNIGKGNTPNNMGVNGTGVIAVGTATNSMPNLTIHPDIPKGYVCICKIDVKSSGIKLCNMFEGMYPDEVKFLFPRTTLASSRGDCEIITTSSKTMMIDASVPEECDYICEFLRKNNITRIDYFLLTHYHPDHYGSIEKFLKQSNVNFKNTKWLLPVGENISGENYAGVLALQNLLSKALADVTILDSDKRIYLSTTCTVDLMCCSDDFRAWMKAQTNTYAPYNAYSIYALVCHHNVKALYSGDGWYPETKWIVRNYQLPHVDLFKVTHHADGYTFGDEDIQFFQSISPTYAVYNQCHLNENDRVYSGAGVVTNICNAMGSKVFADGFTI